MKSRVYPEAVICAAWGRIKRPSKRTLAGIKKTHAVQAKAEIDYKEYPYQTHFTVLQEIKVAQYALGWVLCHANGSRLTTAINQSDS